MIISYRTGGEGVSRDTDHSNYTASSAPVLELFYCRQLDFLIIATAGVFIFLSFLKQDMDIHVAGTYFQ